MISLDILFTTGVWPDGPGLMVQTSCLHVNHKLGSMYKYKAHFENDNISKEEKD